MWNVLLDPYHAADDYEPASAPQESAWHEGNHKTFGSQNQNAGSGKRTPARADSVVAAFGR
jgi:hypothetical protein